MSQRRGDSTVAVMPITGLAPLSYQPRPAHRLAPGIASVSSAAARASSTPERAASRGKARNTAY